MSEQANTACGTCGADFPPFAEAPSGGTGSSAESKHFGVVPPTVDASYAEGDWYFDLTAGKAYVYRKTSPTVYEWTCVFQPSTSTVDLSGYATTASLSAYLTSASAAATYLTQSSLANYVTAGALTTALASYSTTASMQSYVSGLGYLTQAAGDARYVLSSSVATGFVTGSALTAALASYTPTSGLSEALGMSNYLTVSAADASDGFLRKSAVSGFTYVTPSSLATALAPYVTSTALGNMGYLTQTAGDARYMRDGTGALAYATKGYVDLALASYTPTSSLASAIGLSNYLTASQADAADGFVRKSAMASYGYQTSAQVASALSSYVTSSQLSSSNAALQSTVLSAVQAIGYVTSAQLASAVGTIQAAQGAYVFNYPANSSGYQMADRSVNVVTLSGTASSVNVKLPAKGTVARDFTVAILFQTGTGAWTGSSVSVSVSQASGESPALVTMSSESGIFSTSMSGRSTSSTAIVYAFTEIAPCRFLVSRRIVSTVSHS